MLFNSVEFIFGFFPVAVLGFFVLARWSHPAAAAWLALASLFFYGWWNWVYAPLLVASAAFNYVCGVQLARFVRAGRSRAAGTLFALAVTANLLLLGYYKYANFEKSLEVTCCLPTFSVRRSMANAGGNV